VRRFACFARRSFVSWVSVLVLALVFTGCSSPTPQEAVLGFTSAIFQDRVDDSLKFLSARDLSTEDQARARDVLKGVAAGIHDKMVADGGWESINLDKPEPLAGVEPPDELVSIKARFKLKDGSTQEAVFTVVKEAGEWRIAAIK